ncbi:MAG TPA: hypothetical protein VMH32_19175 [Burkholderiales bacterium]|nr:hypothetical protein [Burkholderiales bacterium]
MRTLIAVLMSAMLSAPSLAAYAADEDTQPTTVQSSGNPMDQAGQGTPQYTGAGAVQEGAPAAEGRSDPSGASEPGAGPVTSPLPTGAGRGDNQ